MTSAEHSVSRDSFNEEDRGQVELLISMIKKAQDVLKALIGFTERQDSLKSDCLRKSECLETLITTLQQ